MPDDVEREGEILSLRERIRSTGRRVRRTRLALWAGMVAMVVFTAVRTEQFGIEKIRRDAARDIRDFHSPVLSNEGRLRRDEMYRARVAVSGHILRTALVVSACVSLVACFLFVLPIVLAYRADQSVRLRQVLGVNLTAEQQARALLPLQTERLGDTRKLAALLLDDLYARSGGELIPSEPPAGSGDEISPS